MAVRFPPDVVSFVLIDFKGTGLLLPFQNLPHLAGRISDLDTSIGRNLIALEYELTRRKELLDRWKVSNISDYRRLLREGKADEQLGYLFIVIDEFAEFKNRFPEFMQAVNRVFAVGRTLGVHMILLTQKPAGVVDDKMNANTRFRWCLKVANAADSREMLHHTDAAQITTPGRAYVQVGEDEVYEQIQSYWSGAPYQPFREAAGQTGGQTAVVDLYGNRHCYEPEKQRDTAPNERRSMRSWTIWTAIAGSAAWKRRGSSGRQSCPSSCVCATSSARRSTARIGKHSSRACGPSSAFWTILRRSRSARCR